MDIYDLRKELNSGRSVYELPLKVTFYARVSTGSDEQANSLSNQIRYYSELISNNPNWIYSEGYVDEALSGTSVTKREAFLKMIDDAKLDKFDLIITKEISRFSRNTMDSIKYTQELLRSGVGVLFQSDNINTLMSDSELRLTIMSSIAQDEVRKISERVRFGFKRAIDNGIVLGNNLIWGYTKQEGKLVIDPAEAEIVRMIFELYAVGGLGIRRISTKLQEEGLLNRGGKPISFSTIKNILINPKYKGYYCGGKTQKYDYRSNDRKHFDESEWVMYKDEENVPPIVSEELWDRANSILSARGLKQGSLDRTSYQNKYPYSGKIICAKHGVPFYRSVFRYKSGNKEVWQCKLYSEKGTLGCDTPVIYTTELNQIMMDAYNEVIKNRENIIHDLLQIYDTIGINSTIQEHVARLELDITSLQSKKDKLLDLSIKGVLSDKEFEKRNNGFNHDISTMEKKITDYRLELQKNKGLAGNIDAIRDIMSSELNFEDGFSSSIINTLLDRIEVHQTDNKNIIDLKVYFNVTNKLRSYQIKRGRGTSVCTELHI